MPIYFRTQIFYHLKPFSFHLSTLTSDALLNVNINYTNILQHKHNTLQAEFDKAMADKDAVMAEAQKCQNKLDMAQRLINALSANGVIWEQTVLTVEDDLEVMPGEVLVACAFASYLGVFTRDYREECVQLFVKFLKSKNVPLSNNPDPLKVLSSEAEIAKWAGQGLPSDRVSSENGAIMTNSQRWCLIIDPQLQGITWIKNKEAVNNLQVSHLFDLLLRYVGI